MKTITYRERNTQKAQNISKEMEQRYFVAGIVMALAVILSLFA